MHEEYVEFTQT